MGILDLENIVAEGPFKAAKWGVEQIMDPDMPLYGKEREVYKRGKEAARKDEAFAKGYLKESPYKLTGAFGQPTKIGQPPRPPKPSLDRVVDMVWEGKSDHEIISILEEEGKTREMRSVLERAKRRVGAAKKVIMGKEKRRMEIREIHDIRKSRREEW